MIYPTLSSESATEEINAAEIAQVLELNHFHTSSKVILGVNGMRQFMLEDGRVEEPEYAFMNDWEVSELMSIPGNAEGILSLEANSNYRL